MEQHSIAGGAMSPIENNAEEGFIFDYGVHYVGEVETNGRSKFYFDQVGNKLVTLNVISVSMNTSFSAD